ncbi:Mediator of RNA polymerase II transcription subunit 33A [Rhynchospora pubera]|uniref:Mediator of RNA polymerase II transcription subunit 33A n=1 Tax=Rhynchospora pubera TaxID=906938 RepID=A0AAV8EHJ5_9POAL|nr:Mediator of RNA polymerase II transcription subunit 33A [Rhynchospora pubera]
MTRQALTGSDTNLGNLLHLIVESCIARDLIDTSAYFWPGYVVPCNVAEVPDSSLIKYCPWSNFMQGAPLTMSLQNALINIPAPSVTELKKLNHLALHGSDEERSASSKILCGASLDQGWCIQEHVVHIVVRLLSPQLTLGSPRTGDANFYLSHMHMLATLLSCLSHDGVIHILSLYGLVPDVVTALMPLCEAFGSFPPPSPNQSSTGEEVSPYSVFSFAFLFLLRLCNNYGPDKEFYASSCGGPVRPDLKLDFFLLTRNSRIQKDTALSNRYYVNSVADPFHDLRCHPVYVDSFPNLRACISGSSERISGDEIEGLPHYPAWDLLEAVPLVLDAIFNACAYGPVSSRDLTIGLKGLVDLLPASVAAIIRYFIVEITRGTWKTVPLNGIDWPTPAEALNFFHLEVKEVLERVSVHVQNWYPQDVEPMLPLPLAAFLSLSITFKLDKKSEYISSIIGRTLGNYLLNCPWPIMLTICALWIQKARMWHDFIVLLGARSHFTNDKDAVRQLLSSCFKSFLDAGSMVSNFTTSSNGVVDLLGESVCDRLALRPGILFLSTCHLFRGSPRYFSDMICKLVVEWTCKLADEWTSGGPKQLKFGQTSLAATICAVRRVAILGASLLCMAGRSSLVQYLFEETAPTFLLSTDEERSKQTSWISSMLVGYVISYLLFFSAAIVWGVQAGTGPDKFRGSDMSPYAIKNHLSFIAKATEGNIALRCDPALWKAHVSSFVGLIVRLAPSWVPSTKLDALKNISSSLRRCHEHDLALSLLELGGISAIEAALESLS